MTLRVSGFHLTDSQHGIDIIRKYKGFLDCVIPGWIMVMADGSIQIKRNEKYIKSYLGEDKIIPMVQNFNFDSSIGNNLIINKKAVNNFVSNIIKYLDCENYSGLCIDIKGVKYKLKKQYNEFINKTANKLNDEGYCLSVVIPAKSENNQDSTWSGAYDFSSLGKIVSNVIIMATDFHWPGGPPGPIAPLSWVHDVVDYAIIEIPPEKIYFAFGLYGYDWSLNKEENARKLVYKQIKEIVERYNTRVEWDQESQSPYLRYKNNGLEHEIWFENKRSIEKKIMLIDEFQLKGIVFWKLGQEDPGIWELFK